MLGNLLQGREQQYVSTKDDVTRTWRILDTWHSVIKSMQVDDEIPDDSEAVTILTEGAFISLIQEAARLGVIENASFGSGGSEDELVDLENQLTEMREKLVEYEKENHTLKQNLVEVRNMSEPFRIKTKAMDVVLKLAAMSDIEHMSED